MRRLHPLSVQLPKLKEEDFLRAEKILEEEASCHDPARYNEINSLFHEYLYEPAGNLRLLDMIHLLHNNVARQKMGESQSIDFLMQQIKKDFLFYLESGGGVTFSGGEPFYQEEALRALVNQCQSLGIATAVESCAQFNFTNCKDIIQKLDHIFFDLKVMDTTKHRYFTGIDNTTILQNIKAASYCNDNIVIRMPAIREVNIDDENLEQLSLFLLRQTRIRKIEILPYHTLGKEKMEVLGLPFTSFTAPTADELQGIKEKLTYKGLEVVSYS